MDFHCVTIAKIECDVGIVQVVVGEIFLDYILFVATADDKIVEPVGRVGFHDVPKDWLFAYFDHGFGFQMRFFGDSCTESSSEYDCFHGNKHILTITIIGYYSPSGYNDEGSVDTGKKRLINRCNPINRCPDCDNL